MRLHGLPNMYDYVMHVNMACMKYAPGLGMNQCNKYVYLINLTS